MAVNEGIEAVGNSICPYFGTGVKYAGKFFGVDKKMVDSGFDKLGIKNQSLSSIKYLCHNCGLQWDGYDAPDTFNDIQKATVEKMKRDNMSEKYATFGAFMIVTIISLIFVAISFWIYSYRYVETETISTWLMGDMQSVTYSWHYYVFWPLVIITGGMSFGFLCAALNALNKYYTVKKCPLSRYAKEYLGL